MRTRCRSDPVVGSVIAVTQSDVKRLLAYSAIAHTGFLLIGVFAGTVRGTGAVCFYLAVYGISTVGAFAVAALIGFVFLLWIGLTDSQPGANRFGPNPKGL